MTDLEKLIEESKRTAWAILCMPEAPKDGATSFFGGAPHLPEDFEWPWVFCDALDMEIPYHHLVQIDCSKIQAEDGTYPLGQGRLSVFVEPLVVLREQDYLDSLILNDEAVFVAYFDAPLDQVVLGQPTRIDATIPELREVLPKAFRNVFGEATTYEPKFDMRAIQFKAFTSFPLPGAFNAAGLDQPLPRESLSILRHYPGRLSHEALKKTGCINCHSLLGASSSSALPKKTTSILRNILRSNTLRMSTSLCCKLDRPLRSVPIYPTTPISRFGSKRAILRPCASMICKSGGL